MPRRSSSSTSFSTVHRLWQAKDRVAFFREIRDRVHAIATGGGFRIDGALMDAAVFSTCFRQASTSPCAFDFFGDSLEWIRSFDAETQRTLFDMRSLDLVPVSEFQLVTGDHSMLPHGLCRRVRRAARATIASSYEAVSEGRRYPGMEHWLPLFH